MVHQIQVKFISGRDPLAALQDTVGQRDEFYGPDKEYRDGDMCDGCAVQWDYLQDEGLRASGLKCSAIYQFYSLMKFDPKNKQT